MDGEPQRGAQDNGDAADTPVFLQDALTQVIEIGEQLAALKVELMERIGAMRAADNPEIRAAVEDSVRRVESGERLPGIDAKEAFERHKRKRGIA